MSGTMVCTGNIKLTEEYFLPAQIMWEDQPSQQLIIPQGGAWCAGRNPGAMEPNRGPSFVGLLSHLCTKCVVPDHKRKVKGL